ncbi:MAG: phosphoribosyl-AMP cyclohydrolase [Candidatus Omnitrophica bacterium]|nr:phosphoribosyl-AMP cyclohydrolase [Candidatus Omnitrophota bacterium]
MDLTRFIEELIFNHHGLIPAVIQDDASGRVLTLCYMDKMAILKTIEEKKIYVFRRSSGRLMLKGEVSGNIQVVKSVYVDCADNSLLFKVDPVKAACHEGYFSCFYQKIDDNGNRIVSEERLFDPKEVYRA